MISENEMRELARLVVKSMRIGRRDNREGVAKAKQFFPRVEDFLRRYGGRRIDPRRLPDLRLDERTVERLRDPEVALLRKRGRKYYICGKVGEAVRLVYHPENYAFAKAIAREVMACGAHVMMASSDTDLAVDSYNLPSTEAVEELTPAQLALLRSIDASIRIEGEDNPEWKQLVSAKKIQAEQDARMKLYEVIDERKIRWLYIGWPFKKVAQHYKVSFNWFRRMLFASLKASFSEKTIALAKYYAEALDGARDIEVLHEDGTDLRFSIKGRKVLVDDGVIDEEDLKRGDVGLNLPSGEVFCSPLEDSAEGKIFFEKVHVHGRGFVEGLRLTFEGGAVSEYEASKGEGLFRKFLAENTPSTKTIAELGIGCNPAARWTGYVLTDEKIAGTIHVAIGNNTGAYGGRNKASAHLDMVKDMSGGKLVVDGRVVMRNGKPAK